MHHGDNKLYQTKQNVTTAFRFLSNFGWFYCSKQFPWQKCPKPQFLLFYFIFLWIQKRKEFILQPKVGYDSTKTYAYENFVKTNAQLRFLQAYK